MGALILTALAAGAMGHSVVLDHRGSTFDIEYVARTEMRSKTIGVSPPTRPSFGNQRCVTEIKVFVERQIASRANENVIASVLPARETLTEVQPGRCRGGEAREAVLASKSDLIAQHLATTAMSDRPSALAAIDSARHLAAN